MSQYYHRYIYCTFMYTFFRFSCCPCVAATAYQ